MGGVAGVIGVAIRVANSAVVGVACGIVVGVDSGAVVKVASGTAVEVASGTAVGVASGTAVRDIVSLFKVKLSWFYRAIVIIGLILIRAKLIFLFIYL